jgi:hypothetical protein
VSRVFLVCMAPPAFFLEVCVLPDAGRAGTLFWSLFGGTSFVWPRTIHQMGISLKALVTSEI